MNKQDIQNSIVSLSALNLDKMKHSDFLLTRDRSEDEIRAVLQTAQIFKALRDCGVSLRVFDSGIAVSIFRDKSTRTRFSFMSAANMLGLAVQDLDEAKSQIAHGETVRETANMISFMTETIGIRDDIFLGAGHEYMKQVSEAVQEGFMQGVLPRRPVIVNLQCDIDHPTQAMADLLHLDNYFGGIDNLYGKKIAVSWAYSPSYGKPLSVPQGVIELMSRFGMQVVLANPEGYDLIPEVEKIALENSKSSGGSFTRTNSMDQAFKEADVVYPKSWAPYSVMEKRTELLKAGDTKGLDELENKCLENNRKYIDWECTEKLMSSTNNALYMHCLPADISQVSCKQGEVEASVFERFRISTYKQAGYKPYIIAAVIFLSKIAEPVSVLKDLFKQGQGRARVKQSPISTD